VTSRAVQESARVLGLRRVGAYQEIVLVAPRIAKVVRPGQFVEVAPSRPGPFLLRRPFSVSEADRSPGTGTVSLVFEVIGPGTAALAATRVHDRVDLIGPLGRPFTIPVERTPCVLVGGGYGAAPLLLLAEELRARRCRVDMVLGAATSSRLFKAMDARRAATSLTVTTDDGTGGTRGMVTDVLPELLERARAGPGGGRVFACGPMPMLAAVSRAAAAAGVACEVAVEERMACGTGICFACVVPVHTGEPGGGTRMARSCTEGPVFDGKAVAWPELGLGPAAAAGAAAGGAPAGAGLEPPREELLP
jgi:dihydroorotate dehydrogenase electron transfer subunit